MERMARNHIHHSSRYFCLPHKDKETEKGTVYYTSIHISLLNKKQRDPAQVYVCLSDTSATLTHEVEVFF